MIYNESYVDGIKSLFLRPVLSDNDIAEKSGSYFDADAFPILISTDTDVYDEHGCILAKFRKGVFPSALVNQAKQGLQKHFNASTGFRGMSAGNKKGENKIVKSGIAGYFDACSINTRSHCKKLGLSWRDYPIRVCTFTKSKTYPMAIPFIEAVNNAYMDLAPQAWGEVMERAKKTPFRIGNSCFSTITTNKNFRTALHRDKGDFGKLGVMSVFEEGSYEGSYTGFPKYGICFDMRQGDLLIANVHEWHCNTEKIGDGDRVSIVCYLREGLLPAWEYIQSKREITADEYLQDIDDLKKRANASHAHVAS